MKTLLILFLATSLVVAADPSPPASYPVDARVAPVKSPLAVNILARDLKVIIRNTTTLAGSQGVAMPLQDVALRNVYWTGTPGDPKRWEAHPLTLRPGEETTVPLPLTPQMERKHEIVVEFVTPPDQAVRKVTCPVELNLADDATFKTTGGLSSVEAAVRAGMAGRSNDLLAYYCPPLESWFFTLPDGSASALVKVPHPNAPLPPKAPPGFKPKDYQWVPRPLPRMHPTVPELFGATTTIQPHVEGFSDLGAPVNAALLWQTLARAEKGRLEIHREEATADDGTPAPRLTLVSPR